MYMYKADLALNNLQWLICHKNKPNQVSSRKACQPNEITHRHSGSYSDC